MRRQKIFSVAFIAKGNIFFALPVRELALLVLFLACVDNSFSIFLFAALVADVLHAEFAS